MGVSDCVGELKVMYLGSLVLVIASMTAVEVASIGTLNLMMLRWTDVGMICGSVLCYTSFVKYPRNDFDSLL